MVRLADITKLWQNNARNRPDNALAASFQDMAAMRRYVPYLKDFNFRQTSLQSGDAKSSFKGRGMEFEEVRSYNYGDDVRDIDWRVTARKNEPYTKLYAQEKDRQVYAWLDLSQIMRFGTQKELKSVTAAKTAALIGWFTLHNKDRFGLAVFDGTETYLFEAQRQTEHFLSILKKIEKISENTLYNHQDNAAREKSLQVLQKKLSHRSIIFLISSFTDTDEKLRKSISSLALHNELYMVNIFDALEAAPPPKGEYLAQFNQEQQLIINNGTSFVENYTRHFAQKRQEIKDFCAKFDCRYREIRTDSPIYKQLKPI